MPITSYMSLNLPTVSATVGPEWASMLNAALTSLDAHDHSAGYGKKINPLGLDINADLSFGGNNLTTARSLRMSNQTSAVSGILDIRSLYVYNNDLYYNNQSGTAVQLTAGSAIFGPVSTDNAVARFNGTSGVIQNSGVIIDDSNNVTGIGNLSATGVTQALGTTNSNTTVNIGTGTGTNTINIGGASSTVNITGSVNNQNVTNLNVSDKLVTINDGGAADSGGSSGLEIEEDGVATGYLQTASDRNSWKFKAPNAAGIVTLAPGASDDDVVLRQATQTLTGKSIDADTNTITNIENADIKAGAAIARNKTAVGTADHVVINDGSGVFSSEATLAKSRGGTAQDNSSVTFPASGTIPTLDGTQVFTNKDIDGGTASNSNRLTVPKNTKSNLDGLDRKEATVVYASDEDKLYYDDGSSLRPVGSGGGSGGKNYLEDLYDGSSVQGISTYDDGASATIVDADGGTASEISAAALNSSTPLRGTSSQRLSKTAADAQGQGWVIPIDVDPADYEGGKPLFIQFRYKTSAAYATGDIRMQVYDVDGSAILNVTSLSNSDGSLNASSDTTLYTGVFYPNPSNDDYRIAFHITSTNASAWDLDIIDLKVGPDSPVPGAIITEEQSYTPTFTGLGTVTNINFKWRRIGSKVQIRGKFTTGTRTATEARISLPSGLTSSSAIPTVQSAGTMNYGATTTTTYMVLTEPSVTYMTLGYNSAASGSFDKALGNAIFANSVNIGFLAEVPIEGWTASAALSTTEAMLQTAKFKATKNGTQNIGASTDTKVTSWTVTKDNLGWWDATNHRYVVKRTGRYNVAAGLTLANASSEQYVINIYVNGVEVHAQTKTEANAILQIMAPVDLVANDYIEIFIDSNSDTAYDVVAATPTFFAVTENPDFSIFSTYGQFELLTATSSTKTPGATNNYHQLTGNSISLTPGTWKLFGGGKFGVSGSPVYTDFILGWYSANGADSSSEPAALTAISGLSVLDGSNYYTQGPLRSAGDNTVPAQAKVIRCTSACTIYLVSFANLTTAANARITVYANAERIQ